MKLWLVKGSCKLDGISCNDFLLVVCSYWSNKRVMRAAKLLSPFAIIHSSMKVKVTESESTDRESFP